MSKLKAITINQCELNTKQINEMYQLFCLYYENVNELKFKSDLKEKDKIIILKNQKGKIKGFSTLKFFKLHINHKEIIGIFSGDTIIDKNYWGSSALTMEFFKNVMKTKLHYPFKDVYWFLISKGYKTYLLLANNFSCYFPRYDKDITEESKEIINGFGQKLFKELYLRDQFIIKAAHIFDHIKEDIAPITDNERVNPKIEFFEKMNPHWQKGDELCCIGRIDLGLARVYLFRTLFKTLRKKLFSKLKSMKK